LQQCKYVVAEAQSHRRQRPVSALQTIKRHLNNQPTSQGQVICRSASLVHPPSARSSMSAASQPTTSTEELRSWISRKDADAVSPGTTKKALERFRSLENLSTTSSTTPLRRGSSWLTSKFDVTSTVLPSTQPVSDDARQATTQREAVDATTAKDKADGLQQRPTNVTGRLQDTTEYTTEVTTRKYDQLPRFAQALTKFRSMEDMTQSLSVGHGGVLMKPRLAGHLLPRTSIAERPLSASSLNSTRQQISQKSCTTSDDLRRTTPPISAGSTSPQPEVSLPSALPKYQSLGNILSDLPGIVRPLSFVPAGRRLPRWPPQNIGVPPFASRRAYSVSNVAAAVNDDEVDGSEDLHLLTSTTLPSSCTMASPPSQIATTGVEVATVENVPKTMRSTLHVQLRMNRQVTSVRGSSQCSICILTNHRPQLQTS